MINPFDLPGPQFLVLYAIVGAAILVLVWMGQSSGEGGTPPRIDMSDPYRLAFLRGGAPEAVRVATLTLVDRGLLVIDGDTVMAPPRMTEPTSALERVILRACERPHRVSQLWGDAGVLAEAHRYEAELQRLKLLPDDATQAARTRRRSLAITVLVALSAAKIAVALTRGRTNVMFLVALTALFVVLAFKVTSRFRTARGNALVADLRRLFSRLRERAGELRPGQAPTDLALAAAVFGVAVLPADRFAYVRRLFPRARSSSSSSTYNCGTSCGGGGSSCGGGCGGCGGGGGGD